MQKIFNYDAPCIFKLGPNGVEYNAVVLDVKVVKRVVSVAAITLIYYDLDVFYDLEFSQHTRLNDVHSAYVLPKP
jgi:hypothetical protein